MCALPHLESEQAVEKTLIFNLECHLFRKDNATKADGAGQSRIDATDSKSTAYLRNRGCGIPFDVHFEVFEDEESFCNSVEMAGAH